MSIKWEEPTPSGKNRNKWLPIVEELKEHPGDWAVIAEDVTANLGPMLKRTYPNLETTSRGVKGGRAEKVYARWVGDPS